MLSGVAAHRSYSPTLSALVPSAAASSSTVASRPSVALMARLAFLSFATSFLTCAGNRIVRP